MLPITALSGCRRQTLRSLANLIAQPTSAATASSKSAVCTCTSS